MEFLFYIIFLGLVGSGIFFIIKGSSKKAFLLISLGINITVLPLAFFIGIMATDAPTSTNIDFIKGFLFIQAIPIILLLISIIKFFSSSKIQKKSNVV